MHLRHALLALAFAGLTTAAVGQTPTVPHPEIPQPAPAPAGATLPTNAGTAEAPVMPAQPITGPVTQMPDSALDKQLQDLAALKQSSALLQAQLQTEDLKGQLAKAQGTSTGATNGTDELPQLVGIVSSRNGIVAEFLAGDAILQAKPGDWVSQKWRLTRVLSNGVEVSKKGSRATYTVLFGSSNTVRGSLTQYGGNTSSLPAAPRQ